MNDASNAKTPTNLDQLREKFQNLHEIVHAARAKLDRNYWDYLIGGA
jgi:hypothetical protein